MDLSNAFDTLNYNLLLAKLNAYGFLFQCDKVAQNNLYEQFQRVNKNNNFSEYGHFLRSVH